MTDGKLDPATVASVAGVAIKLLPDIMALVRTFHQAKDPDAATPDDAAVLEGLRQAVQSSVAKDDAWLAAHPEPGT